MKQLNRYFLYFLALHLVGTCSCKKLIEIDPPKNQLGTKNVYTDSTSTLSALYSIYIHYEKDFEPAYLIPVSLYTDELNNLPDDQASIPFYQSNVSPSDVTNQNIWTRLYLIIYQCNDLLENNVNGRIKYEALFLRAYAYFNLVNLYGNVPLIVQTDVSITSKANQSDPLTVNNQIIKDLKDCMVNLPIDYPAQKRSRVNKWTAAALLARVYLYQKNYEQAEDLATAVITSGLYALEDPEKVFLTGSHEAIFQISTQDGYLVNTASLNAANPTTAPQFPITPGLYESFSDQDLRKTNWIGTSVVGGSGTPVTYHYAFKYKNRSSNASAPESFMVSRLAEMYLIRAEARAQLNNTRESADDLNMIRQRAKVTLADRNTDQQQLLNLIQQERRKEFFTEGGHRFFDLKRTDKIGEVLGSYKNTWKPRAIVLPIPQTEITYNQNLHQNADY